MNQPSTCLLLMFLSLGIWSSRGALSQDGFHRESGQHINLVTDIESAEERRTLVQSFDAAALQWESFWQQADDTAEGFRVEAYVMRDKEAFRRQGLIAANVPAFPFGYALGNKVWVVAQKSEYYTRHLLLHEGVHAWAFSFFGGAGPSWFMEGTAELLSVHEGKGPEVKVNRVPTSSDDVPYWGRFALMRRRLTVPSLNEILGYPRDLKSDVESYGWSWAVAMLLTEYDDTRDQFIKAARNGRDTSPAFNAKLRQGIRNWPVVVARWRLMCQDLDYGFDWSREKVDLAITDRISETRFLKQKVHADRGWQSLGVRFTPGMQLQIEPSGQVTLADQPKPWISEPAGITFRYHRGRPLGQLLAVIVPNVAPQTGVVPGLEVVEITETATLEIKQHCWLLFRVNDYVGELADNQGAYEIKVQRLR